MRTFAFIAIIVALMAVMVYSANQTDKKLKAKDERIKELEQEVWSLKLDRRLDSIREYHVGMFRKRLGLYVR